ncbi:beta-L-arabinofuranosidase domain-containing protein [Sunxiuqinia sp. A32]|uniref:beta-L-arabinofuranosidase domain-containing protein n=1 Tax=Sunxiuqinia sp. A32 TaxID=3461496 RepID=UPI00404522C4
MKRKDIIFILIILCSLPVFGKDKRNSYYITNQKPLVSQPYTALPLGAIKPQGMLLEMLKLQANGLTGHLDSIYNVVCGDNNGWLGGTGDGWERGPYWLDGLVPLAYLLDDEELIAKAQKWVEWSLNNQREDGYLGPLPLADGYEIIPGTQQGMREDWWPKMVMLKVLQQYYTATSDQRVVDLMTGYFQFQWKMIKENKAGFDEVCANRRGGDNLAVIYWLFNITGDKFLLELADEAFNQIYDWTSVFSGNDIRQLSPLPGLHCVNVAQGLKEPVVYYQQHPDQKYLNSLKAGLASLKACHGFVNGMYGGDEKLHGNDPTQASEFCSAVEMMYSFESVLPITGDVFYADYLEKLAYNVLPTQATDDYLRRQYFQQVNQIKVTDESRNFFDDHNGRHVFGTTAGYPCCLTNMHQGWPKFIQNLWYATADDGVAALVYGPSKVSVKVANGEKVTINEITDYPFKNDIKFEIETNTKVKFPFHLRIPEWCHNSTILLNGKSYSTEIVRNIAIINREWTSGDVVELKLDAEFRFSYWFENSLGIERGPLVYALKVEEEWREVTKDGYDDTFWEVLPKSPWNYAILESEIKENKLEANVSESIAVNPWNLKNAPIQVKTKARRMPQWTEERNSAGKIPVPSYPSQPVEDFIEKITLIPYGCTTLRIAQFPVR